MNSFFVDLSEYPVNINQHSKVPILLPPTNSPDGSYHEQPILDYDAELPSISERRSTGSDIDFLDEEKDIFPLPNVRRRRQNDDQARLLSQSAFNRITETLGALNAVGKFFLNMTREVNGDNNRRDDMQLISSSSSSNLENTNQPSTEKISIFSTDLSTSTQESETTKILSTTKSSTKTTESFNKRIGLSQQPVKGSKIDDQTLNEKIDMAALAEKKRKKHQTINTKKEILTTHASNQPGNLKSIYENTHLVGFIIEMAQK